MTDTVKLTNVAGITDPQVFDVAIAGGGLAGSAAAAVLGRAGFRVALVDIHSLYPPDFRAEKLTRRQSDLLAELDLLPTVLSAATPIDELWVARFGRLVEKKSNTELGIAYEALVNAVRSAIPDNVTFVAQRIVGATSCCERPMLHLADGTAITARLVVLATGLGQAVARSLSIGSRMSYKGHSLVLGFDIEAREAPFGFSALTYHPETTLDRMAYLTLFPVGARMRANLFVYRNHQDPWVRAFRTAPRAELLALMSGLHDLLPPFDVVGQVAVRPIDLQNAEDPIRDGVVLIGDAFGTSCPTGGTGVDKVLTDVLCLGRHVTQWFATPGIGRDKIAAFYDDPRKTSCDARADGKSKYAHALALDTGWAWKARRWRNYLGQRVRYFVRARLWRRDVERPQNGFGREAAPGRMGDLHLSP